MVARTPSIESHTEDPMTEGFDPTVLICRCWDCGADMTYDAGHHLWACSCGFVLGDRFSLETRILVDQLVRVGELGLAKHRNGNSFGVIQIRSHPCARCNKMACDDRWSGCGG